ncbi:MAG: hypothetical protein FI725_02355 [SAR202 cluster bacterium]|nr:hypothetical protein [SAR202 cluster bacterium]
MGLARLDKLKEDFTLEIDYKTFYLRPDIPPEGRVRDFKDGEKAGDPVGGRMAEAAADAGVIMRRAPLTPNSRFSFEASEYAKDKGIFEPFHTLCYKSFWEDGANLGEISVLQDIGKAVGLDPDELKKEIDRGTYTARAQSQYEEATKLGVQGIPSFVIGRYFFSGAQPYELFKEVAERVLKEQAGQVDETN